MIQPLYPLEGYASSYRYARNEYLQQAQQHGFPTGFCAAVKERSMRRGDTGVPEVSISM